MAGSGLTEDFSDDMDDVLGRSSLLFQRSRPCGGKTHIIIILIIIVIAIVIVIKT